MEKEAIDTCKTGNKIEINDCFSIGYRCTADDFMKDLNIRKYSSPFSYNICDLESSFNFIDSQFVDYTNVTLIKKGHHFTWLGGPLEDLFFNVKYLPKDEIDITTLKRICVWNHHRLDDKLILDAIERRSKHLLDALKSTNVLLIYIENVKIYSTNKWEEYINSELVEDFVRRHNCNILILIPLLNYSLKPELYKINNFINVIMYESNMEGYSNDFSNSRIEWNLIKKIVLENYTFNIQSDGQQESSLL